MRRKLKINEGTGKDTGQISCALLERYFLFARNNGTFSNFRRESSVAKLYYRTIFGSGLFVHREFVINASLTLQHKTMNAYF